MRTTSSSTRSRRAAAPLLVVAASLHIAGCYDGPSGRAADDDGTTTQGATAESGEASSTGEDEIPQHEVLLDVPTVALDGPCFARDAAERAATVSPEGDLWLLRDDAEGTSVRSIAPDAEGEIVIALPFTAEAAQAWTRDRGTVLGSGGLWSIDAGFAEPIRWPDDAPSPLSTCGDPSHDGDALVLAGDVWSRDVGQWWSWNLPGDALAVEDRVATSVGACSGHDGRAFMLRGDEVWTVERDWLAPRPELGPARALAADASFGAAAIVDDALQVLDPDDAIARVVFEAGAVQSVVAAPGVLWVRAGDRLYRSIDGEWNEAVDADGAIADEVVGADAQGGLWIVRDDEVCHRGVGPRIRVDGVRPYERRRTSDLVLDIEAAEPPVVTLDGEAIHVTEEGEGFGVVTDVDEGWHDLVIEAGDARRSIAFAVEGLVPATWEADIAPLFDAHCSGAACHGPDPSADERPDFSEYASWVENADVVLDRVVATGDMPPPGSGSFGVDEMLLVVEWIEAGLPESEED